MYALQQVGDDQVVKSSGNVGIDPVFLLLSSIMSAGATVTSFHLTTSVNGDVLELSVVWHVIRCALRAKFEGRLLAPTLAEVLQPVVARGVVIPATANTCFVPARMGLPGTVANERGTPTHLHLLNESAEPIVLYGIDAAAGVDTAFTAIVKSGSVASVVMVQDKARVDARLSDALRSASPAWQYMTGEERLSVLDGTPIVPTGKRAAYEALADTAPFRKAFRVVMSASGYADGTAAMCNALNELEAGCSSSPIILCEPTPAAFGVVLDGQLRAACAGKPTSSTKKLAYLLPQNVGDVSNAKFKSGSEAVKNVVERRAC